jgi:hypothetical protein
MIFLSQTGIFGFFFNKFYYARTYGAPLEMLLQVAG